MTNQTKVSDGELSQMRRAIRIDPHAYSEATRAIVQGSSLETGDFFADESVRYHNHLFFMQQNTPEELKTNSREGYFVGRDFLTNQPIFRRY